METNCWQSFRIFFLSRSSFTISIFIFFGCYYCSHSLFIRRSFIYRTLDYILVQFDKLKDFWLYKLGASEENNRQKQTKKEQKVLHSQWCVAGGRKQYGKRNDKSYFSSSGAINCHHISWWMHLKSFGLFRFRFVSSLRICLFFSLVRSSNIEKYVSKSLMSFAYGDCCYMCWFSRFVLRILQDVVTTIHLLSLPLPLVISLFRTHTHIHITHAEVQKKDLSEKKTSQFLSSSGTRHHNFFHTHNFFNSTLIYSIFSSVWPSHPPPSKWKKKLYMTTAFKCKKIFRWQMWSESHRLPFFSSLSTFSSHSRSFQIETKSLLPDGVTVC